MPPPLGGRLLYRGCLIEGASIRYGAFIGSWAFIRSFTVCEDSHNYN